MTSKISVINRVSIAKLLLLVSWLLLCLLLQKSGILQFGKVVLAFAAFSYPGAQLFLLLQPATKQPPAFITTAIYGFVLSISLVSTLGLLSRLLSSNFQFVWWGFISFGIGATLFSIYRNLNTAKPQLQLDWSWRQISLMISSLLCFTLLFIIAGAHNSFQLEFGEQALFYDLTWYFGQINHFIVDTTYSWNDVFLGAGTLYPDRWLLALWPLSEAVILNISGLHVLEYQFSMMFGLAAIAIALNYQLCKDLGLSTNWSLLAATTQVILILFFFGIEKPGEAFVNYLSDDKVFVSFILIPAWIASLLRYKSVQTLGNWGVYSAVGLAVATTHSVGVAAGAVIILSFLVLENFNAIVPKFTAFAGTTVLTFLAIFLMMRVLDDRGNGSITSNILSFENLDIRYATFRNTNLLIMNPQLLGVSFYFLLVAAVICCLIYIKHRKFRMLLALLAPVISICTPGVASIMAGALTTTVMWRLMWIFPFALVFIAFIAQVITDVSKPVALVRYKYPVITLVQLICLVFTINFYSQYAWKIQPGISLLANPQQSSIYSDYITIGKWIDQKEVPLRIVDFSDQTIAHILSGNVTTLTKRPVAEWMTATNGITLSEAETRIHARTVLIDNDQSKAAQVIAIQDYNLNGILLPTEDAQPYKETFSTCIVDAIETQSWTLLQLSDNCG